MPSFFRLDGFVITPTGIAVAGAQVAILTQPASFATQPGSPLQTVYAANASNSLTITAAVWNGQQITFTFSTSLPPDLTVGSYIGVSGVSPAGYNSTISAPWLVVGLNSSLNQATVTALTNPGAYVSGGTAATSVLPNPTQTDNDGNFFFYAAPGIYSVQIYGPPNNPLGLTERDLLDQDVGGVGSGSVTSVALTAPAQFSVTGSPITTNGTLAISWTNENANLVLAGPTSGLPAAPTFRGLVAADLPAGTGTVTSVAYTLTVPSIMGQSVTGSPITASGTIAATISLVSQAPNIVFAGPTSGGSATPGFRSLVAADLPAVQRIQITLSGTTDALTFPSDTWIDTTSVDATTLGTPVPTTDDGKRIQVVDVTGHAHTITTAANKIVPSHSIATFNGVGGSFIVLEANQGLWYIVGSSGVTVS